MSKKIFLSFLLVFASLLSSARADAVADGKKNLLQALKNRDEGKVAEAVKGLVVLGGKNSIHVFLGIIPRFPRGEEKLYWMLLHGATSYHDPAALQELANFIVAPKNKGYARDFLFALAQNSSWEVLSVLRTVLEKGAYDLKITAIDQMSSIRRVETVDALLAAWKAAKGSENTVTLCQRILRSLTALTGENMGDLYENWKSWWDQNRSKGLRRSEGETGRTGTVVDRLGNSRKSEFDDLRNLPKESVVVIIGSPCKAKGVEHDFDHIQDTLKDLKIPHITVTKKDFNDHAFSMKGRMIILINCSLSWEHCVCPSCKAGGGVTNRLQTCTGCDKHDIETDRISPEGIEKIKAFVGMGGYLFTEDWVLVELLDKAWPEMVRKGDPTMKEFTSNVVPGQFQGSHSYLRGIFGFKKKEESKGDSSRGTVEKSVEDALKKAEHTWKIDRESPSIKVTDVYKVVKLMVSKELGNEVKGNDSVAITFSFVGGNKRPVTGSNYGEISEMRGGRVLHVISHFGKQKSSEDEFTLQNLMLNFFIEAKQRMDWRKGKK